MTSYKPFSSKKEVMASKECHVMMFPWMAFGHMIPFFELSKRLASKGIRVSFVSSPRNLQRMPPIPPNLAEKIKMVEIPLPPVDGLPENCEATVDLQIEQVQYLKMALDNLQAPFENLMHTNLPDLILFDFVQCWIPRTAATFGVPCAYFSAYSASTLAFTGPPTELKTFTKRSTSKDLTTAPDWFTFPSLLSFQPDQAAEIFEELKSPDKSGMTSAQRFAETLEGCDFVAVRSCKEFESAYLDLLKELYQKPVLATGLLPPICEENKERDQTESNSNWFSTFKWLDRQQPKSVLFVGFGSEYKMPVEEVHELAYGIEHSELPFLWILRKPEGLDSSDLLPAGFLARTSSRGIVCLGWAPQMQILAHPAIGGCLFHSGWGTIIESLGFGHPQILLPMVADQGLNAKLLVEKGIGFEVPRNEDGSFTQDAIAKSARLVMLDPEGEKLRLQAAKVQTIFANQDLHDNYINDFIEFLQKLNKKDHHHQVSARKL